MVSNLVTDENIKTEENLQLIRKTNPVKFSPDIKETHNEINPEIS